MLCLHLHQQETLHLNECRSVGQRCCDLYNCCINHACIGIDKFCVKLSSSEIVQWEQAVNAVQIELIKDIPSECHDHGYEVALNAVVKHGSHFFLSATSSNKDNLNDDKCPKALVFASIDGRKVTYLVSNEDQMNGYFRVHLLGKASLKEIIKAESNANAVDDSAYDLTKNSCIHYAGDISRGLEFDETPELAEFLIENLLMDDGLIDIARDNINFGGLHVLSNYVLTRENFNQYVKDMVFSQLNIK